jgi:hypothetical protein
MQASLRSHETLFGMLDVVPLLGPAAAAALSCRYAPCCTPPAAAPPPDPAAATPAADLLLPSGVANSSSSSLYAMLLLPPPPPVLLQLPAPVPTVLGLFGQYCCCCACDGKAEPAAALTKSLFTLRNGLPVPLPLQGAELLTVRETARCCCCSNRRSSCCLSAGFNGPGLVAAGSAPDLAATAAWNAAAAFAARSLARRCGGLPCCC